MNRYNPACDFSDPTVRDALYRVFGNESGVKQFGDSYRMAEIVDAGGVRVLIIQRRTAGEWGTVLAVSADGNLYLKGTLSESQDFDALGWNPRGL